MNPFERIQGAFGQMNPQQQQAAAQMLSPQQNQQQMVGLGPQVATPAAEAAQQAPKTGMFSKFNNHLQDNKSAMMALSAGMMGGPGQPGSIGQGFQNYAAAGPLDEQRREKEQNKNVTAEYLKSKGHSDQEIEFFVANPQAMAQALKPATGTATSGMKEYQLAQQQGFGGSFFDFKKELAKSGASNISFNNEQAKAAGFADRAAAAEVVLSDLDTQGTETGARLLDAVPFGLGNHWQSSKYQQFDQARRDFVNATLRRESGAVISEQEFANAEKQYFPQPGDDQEVIQQKKSNRAMVIEGMVRGAGNSYGEPQAQEPAQQPPDLSGMSDADLEAISNGVQ